jgi:hypothetical protein
MLGNPHLVFLTPSIIRLPHLEPHSVFPARFGNENSFVGVRNLNSGDDEYFL